MLITGVERWDFAHFALPEFITLILFVLGSCPAVFVGVVGVHVWNFYEFTQVCLCEGGD